MAPTIADLPAEGIEVRYGLAQLRADWRRLALTSDFLGETTAQACFAQRVVSSAVNELLELVYRLGAENGAASLSVAHAQNRLQLKLNLPLDAQLAEQVRQEVAALDQVDPQRAWFEQLGHAPATSNLFGMLYLMADYGAHIEASTDSSGLELRMSLSTAEGSPVEGGTA